MTDDPDEATIEPYLNEAPIDSEKVPLAAKKLHSALKQPKSALDHLRQSIPTVILTGVTAAVVWLLVFLVLQQGAILYVIAAMESVAITVTPEFIIVDIPRDDQTIRRGSALVAGIITVLTALISHPLLRAATNTPASGRTIGVLLGTDGDGTVDIRYTGGTAAAKNMLDEVHIDDIPLPSGESRTEFIAAYLPGDENEAHAAELVVTEDDPRDGFIRGAETTAVLEGESDQGLPLNDIVDELAALNDTTIVQVVVQQRHHHADIFDKTEDALKKGTAASPFWRFFVHLDRLGDWFAEEDDDADSSEDQEPPDKFVDTNQNRLCDINVRVVTHEGDEIAKDLFKNIAPSIDSVTPDEISITSRSSADLDWNRIKHTITPSTYREHKAAKRRDRIIDDVRQQRVYVTPQHYTITQERKNIIADDTETLNLLLVSGDGSNRSQRALDVQSRSQSPTTRPSENQMDDLRLDDLETDFLDDDEDEGEDGEQN